MKDFVSALAEGKKTWEAAEPIRRQVREVLREFMQAIDACTPDGVTAKTGIKIVNQIRHVGKILRDFDTDFIGPLELDGISVTGPGGERRIVNFKLAAEIYPVLLDWWDESRICMDKAELESGLEEVLKDPRTARSLARVEVQTSPEGSKVPK